MAKIATMIAAAMVSGALALSFVPEVAEAKGRGAKSTASSASKARPGQRKYSKKTTKRAPSRTAASVLKERARKKDPSEIKRYKSAKKSRSKSSASRQLAKGKPAKDISNVAKPGPLTNVNNQLSSLISGKPKASPRKVDFRFKKRPNAKA